MSTNEPDNLDKISLPKKQTPPIGRPQMKPLHALLAMVGALPGAMIHAMSKQEPPPVLDIPEDPRERDRIMAEINATSMPPLAAPQVMVIQPDRSLDYRINKAVPPRTVNLEDIEEGQTVSLGYDIFRKEKGQLVKVGRIEAEGVHPHEKKIAGKFDRFYKRNENRARSQRGDSPKDIAALEAADEKRERKRRKREENEMKTLIGKLRATGRLKLFRSSDIITLVNVHYPAFTAKVKEHGGMEGTYITRHVDIAFGEYVPFMRVTGFTTREGGLDQSDEVWVEHLQVTRPDIKMDVEGEGNDAKDIFNPFIRSFRERLAQEGWHIIDPFDE